MNFSSMLCLAFANAEGFMSLWKPEDQGVPATNDLTEVEDLTLTAPSPLQRLLNSNDDEEQEDEDKTEEDEHEDEGGNNVISEKIVPGVVGAVAMGALCAGAKWLLTPTPERVITIKLKSALTKDQKAKLDKEDEVLFAEGTQIISNLKTVEEFTSKYTGIDVDSHEQRDVTEVKGGDETKFVVIDAVGDLFCSTDKKKYQKTETKPPTAKTNTNSPGGQGDANGTPAEVVITTPVEQPVKDKSEEQPAEQPTPVLVQNASGEGDQQ